MKKYIAYYRVSTKGQEISGLGLDAQREIVTNFIEKQMHNLDEEVSLYAEFTDIETGTKSKSTREGLNNAIRSCRALSFRGENVTLLIAKLDRLSRNVAFISTLKESGIKFVACDMPDANNFTINIFAALAEQEAEMISKRTKEALAAKLRNNPDQWIDKNGKHRNGFGNPENLIGSFELGGSGYMASVNGKKRAKQVKREIITDENNIRSMNYAATLRSMDMSFRRIANKMNNDGFRTYMGGIFTSIQVKRLLDLKKHKDIEDTIKNRAKSKGF